MRQKGELTLVAASQRLGVGVDTIASVERYRAERERPPLSETYPGLAREWHVEKNDHHRLDDFTHGSTYRAWWRCAVGHEWSSRITERVRGRGCPTCAYRAKGLKRQHGELSMEEAGQFLGLSKATVWRRIRDGKLPERLTWAAVRAYARSHGCDRK